MDRRLRCRNPLSGPALGGLPDLACGRGVLDGGVDHLERYRFREREHMPDPFATALISVCACEPVIITRNQEDHAVLEISSTIDEFLRAPCE
jgi:hypothetical protein